MVGGLFKDFTVLVDGRIVCLGSNDFIYFFMSSPKLALAHKLFDKYCYQAYIISACPGPELLVAVGGKAGLAIFDCANNRRVFKLPGNIATLTWSPSSRFVGVVVESDDGYLSNGWCIDMKTMDVTWVARAVSVMSFSPFENWLVIGICTESSSFGGLDKTKTQF